MQGAGFIMVPQALLMAYVRLLYHRRWKEAFARYSSRSTQGKGMTKPNLRAPSNPMRDHVRAASVQILQDGLSFPTPDSPEMAYISLDLCNTSCLSN